MKKREVVISSPTRIDLAGGTLDIPPIYLFHQPALTVNIAIEIKTRASIMPDEKFTVISHDQKTTASWKKANLISWEDHPRLELILRLIKSFNPQENLKIEVSSEAPTGSGLGSSSSLTISLTVAMAKWQGHKFTPAELVEYAKSIETQTIKVPTGYQDYWAAVYGGVHAYEMGLKGVVNLTKLGSESFYRELENHLLLVYVGRPHFSGTNNWELFKQYLDGNRSIISFFEGLKENALAMKEAMQKQDLNKIAKALNQDWQTRKAMLPDMTTPEIEKLVTKTFKKGAYAARGCGAGGGGCVLLLIDPKKHGELTKIAEDLGMQVLPSRISREGTTTISP